MNRQHWGWHSERLPVPARVVRWGHWGTPVLLFPTAGGDFEEVERFRLIHALAPLIDAGRIKVYSIDSVAGCTWLERRHSVEYCARVQNLYDAFVYRELVPLIYADCGGQRLEIVTCGASIGAFNAVASLCRHPDAFRLAIGLSGTYDLTSFLHGRFPQDFYFSSPLHYLPGLAESSPQLQMLRQRKVLLVSGSGRFEDIGESWRMAHVLGAKGVPNRVDDWGPSCHHDWVSWRELLPRYLAEYA